jgi:hypothetical protein
MNAKQNSTLISKCGRGSLVRPRYSPGLLLEDEDLTTAVTYTQSSLRLVLRSLFGCGVVCGLAVEGLYTCERRKVQITIHKGVALDCQGNVIDVCRDEVLEYDPGCKPVPDKLWVAVCYAERPCMPSRVSCCEEDEEKVVDRRILDAYDIRIYREQPECACACGKAQTVAKKEEDKCCGDQAVSNGADSASVAANGGGTMDGLPTARPKDPCDCYKAHNEGLCACDCSGTCVVVGWIVPDAGEKWKFAKDAQRFVRPMLLGAQACYCKECQASEKDVEKPPKRPAAPTLEDWGAVEETKIREHKWKADEWAEILYRQQVQLDRLLKVDKAAAGAAVQKAQDDEDSARAAASSAELIAAAQAVKESAQRRLKSVEDEIDALQQQYRKSELSLQAAKDRLKRAEAHRRVVVLQRELAYTDESIIVARSQALADTPLVDNRKRLVVALSDALAKLGALT